MKRTIFFLFLPIFFLASCDESPRSILNTVRHSESNEIREISKPEYVCEFSDGRKLFRIEIGIGNGWYNHFVYFFNSSKEISINFNEKVGKMNVNKTIVQLPE